MDEVPGKNQEPGLPPSPKPALRRKRWIGVVIKLILILFLLLVIAVVYLQSAHALRHVIMPRVANSLGTKIDFNEGDIGLNGVLEMVNLAVHGSDGRPAFTAEKLYIRIDPRLLLGGNLVVREAQLSGAQVRYAIDQRGRNNWDFIAPGDSKTAESKSHEFPQIHIDQLTIDKMELEYSDGKGLTYLISPLNLSASNLQPGQEGQVQLKLSGEGRQTAVDVAQALDLNFAGKLKQGTAGDMLGWSGALSGNVRQSRAMDNGSSKTQQLQLAGETAGSYEQNGNIDANVSLKAATPQGDVGDVKTTVAWNPASGKREMNFDVRNVGPDALNPLLVAVGPLQLESASIEGHGKVSGSGDLLKCSLDLNGRQLSFKRGKLPVTDVMQLSLKHQVNYDLKTRRIRVETFSTKLEQQQKTLIEAKLNQPAELNLGLGAAALNEAGAQLAININDITWEDLKPWLLLLGGRERQILDGGNLKGKVTIDLTRGGRTLAMSGGITASGLKFSGFDAPPLGFTQQFHGSFVDFKTISVDQGAAVLNANGESLTTIKSSSLYALDKQIASLTWQIETRDLTHLIDVFNGSQPPPANLSEGKLSANQKLTLDGNKQFLGLEGTLQLTDLKLKMKEGTTPLSANGKIKLTLDQVKQLAQIDQVELLITGAGATEPGVVTFTGNWPLSSLETAKPGAAPQAGNLKLSVKRMDAAPWLALAGFLHGDPLPRLPLEANEEINVQADEIRIKGKANVGLPPGKIPSASQPQEVEIEHALNRAGNAIQHLLLKFDAKADTTALSGVQIEGNVQTAPAARFDLTAKAASLDLDALLARIDAILGSTPAKQPEASAAAQPATPETVLNAKLDVARLIWNGQNLTDAQAKASFEKGIWTISIDKSQLNGGPFKGQYTYDGYRSDPHMAWDLQTERSPMDKLIAIASPEAAKKLNGLGTIRTRGSCEGKGEKLKNSLQSDTQFSIADGELRENRFLNALADQPYLGSFRSVKFFDFSGVLKMENGRVDLNECVLRGKTHRIDVKGYANFDGKYEITMMPAFVAAVAERIPGQNIISSLVRDATGFLQFPFGVTVRGEPGKYIVLPRVELPVKAGGMVGQVVGGVTSGVNQGIGLVGAGVKGTVGGVFRTAGKGLDVVTGGGGDKNAPTTNTATEDRTTTGSERSVVGKTTEKLGETVDKSTGKVKEGVGGVIHGIGGILGRDKK